MLTLKVRYALLVRYYMEFNQIDQLLTLAARVRAITKVNPTRITHRLRSPVRAIEYNHSAPAVLKHPETIIAELAPREVIKGTTRGLASSLPGTWVRHRYVEMPSPKTKSRISAVNSFKVIFSLHT